MAIRGSLDTFSLPELFHIIESGHKSGKLSFTPSSKNSASKLEGVFELWFDSGNFVGIVHSLNCQSLIGNIQENNWIDSKVLVKAKFLCPKDLPLGKYLREQKLLNILEVNSLFKKQLDLVKKLFNVERAWFKFEELNNKTTRDGESFPYKEMTGQQKSPAELSIEAMRDFSDWQRFEEDLPTPVSGLKKLVNKLDIQLTSLEARLWNSADGTVSLNNIAKQTANSIETVQHTALTMILAGIAEEIPIAGAIAQKDIAQLAQSQANRNSRVSVKTAVKPQVSSSLINNLASFLKKNL